MTSGTPMWLSLAKVAGGVGGMYALYDAYQSKMITSGPQMIAAAALFAAAAAVAIRGATQTVYGGAF